MYWIEMILGWFRRNNLIMLQAKNLAKQLNEAWAEQERLDKAFDFAAVKVAELRDKNDNLRDQLHRVARERDNERKLRLEADDRLLTDGTPYHKLIYAVATKYPNETRHETALRYIMERENQERRAKMSNDKLEQAAEELRDTYLEELENEEE